MVRYESTCLVLHWMIILNWSSHKYIGREWIGLSDSGLGQTAKSTATYTLFISG